MSEFMPPEPSFDDGESPQSKEDKEFDRMARKNFIASAKSPNHIKWRRDAVDDFDFVAGGSYDDSGQWHQDQIDALKSQGRPIITLNTLEPLIEAIAGAEVNNRQEVSYEPRENDDKDVAAALMEVGKWARDNDVEEEESDAFRNCVICGMGWTLHTMDYSTDLDGRYTVVSTDPVGHYWDVDARRPNLADARWVGYVEKMGKDKFKAMFPDQKGSDDVFGVKGIVSEDDTRAAKYPTDYDDPNLIGTEGAETPEKVLVLEYQCYKPEPAFRVLDPASGQLSKPMDKDEFSKLRSAAESRGAVMARFGTPVDPPEDGSEPPQVFRFLKQERNVYYRAFYSGGKRLEDRERNPWRRGFTMQCITARRHRSRNTWYGLVRPMKDPQRFTNSFMAASIHHYNANPKGGVYYEEDAIDNPEDLEGKLAHPSPAIKLNPGGLQKIEHINPAPSSQALVHLLGVVMSMPPQVSGVNLETVGLANRDQPVGLEQTRKLATMSIVSPIFSSNRRYRKQAGRLLFDFIKDYIPESTLMRVVSAGVRPAVKMIKDADTLRFDVHVDDAPLSPSVKATVFNAMKDFAQFMFENLPPKARMLAVKAFFRYSPLPADLTRELEAAMDEGMKPDPKEEQATMLALEKLKADIEETGAKTELTDAKVELTEAQTETELDKPDLESDKLILAAIDSRMNFEQTKLQLAAARAKGNSK